MKSYAMGVLGLRSLLLTRLRFEHPAAILDAEAMAEQGGGDDAARM